MRPPPGDLFVGGSFESRVWDGSQFVIIHDIAYYKGNPFILVRFIISICRDVCCGV